MSSIILSDKGDAMHKDSAHTATPASIMQEALNSKLEDRRPGFLESQSSGLPSIVQALLVSQGPALDRSQQTTEYSLLDNLNEVEEILKGGLPFDVPVSSPHQPTPDKSRGEMGFEEDDTWQEFCDDLPME